MENSGHAISTKRNERDGFVRPSNWLKQDTRLNTTRHDTTPDGTLDRFLKSLLAHGTQTGWRNSVLSQTG